MLVRAANSSAVFEGHKVCAKRITLELVCKSLREMVQALALRKLAFSATLATFDAMTTPAYALTRAPEIEKTEVQKIEGRSDHALVRLLGKNCDVCFAIDLQGMRSLAEQIVHVGLDLNEERKLR